MLPSGRARKQVQVQVSPWGWTCTGWADWWGGGTLGYCLVTRAYCLGSRNHSTECTRQAVYRGHHTLTLLHVLFMPIIKPEESAQKESRRGRKPHCHRPPGPASRTDSSFSDTGRQQQLQSSQTSNSMQQSILGKHMPPLDPL